LETPIKILTDGYPQVGVVQAGGSKQVEILAKANGSATTYYVAVADESPIPTYAQVKNGQDSTGNSALVSGNVILKADVQASAIVNLPADDTNYDIYVVLYEEHHGGSFVTSIWSEVVKLDIKTPVKAWEVSNATDLENALTNFKDGDTIKLANSIEYNKRISISSKAVTMDIGPHTLDVNPVLYNGFEVHDAAAVNVIGSGVLNITGVDNGLHVKDKGSFTADPSVTCKIMCKNEYYYNNDYLGNGIYVSGEGEVSLSGNVIGAMNGVQTDGSGTVAIKGDVVAAVNNISTHGIYARGGTVTVDGNVMAQYGLGVYCVEKGEVSVTGNVTGYNRGAIVSGSNSASDCIIMIGGNLQVTDKVNGKGAEFTGEGTITVEGEIIAPIYIRYPTVIYDINDNIPSNKPGYRMYQMPGYDGIVYVKDSTPPITHVGDEFTEIHEGVPLKYKILTIGAGGNTVEVIANYEQDDSGNYKGYTEITIPNTVTYQAHTYYVTGIAKLAFQSCASLTSIIIPNTITSIGDYAFSGCISLVDINLPNSLGSIGDAGFLGCYSLKSVVVPDSVTELGQSTFRDCISLESVELPNIKIICDSSFAKCPSLNKIVIPNSVETIESSAFSECYGLTKITIPVNVTSIGANAFWNCTKLTEITFLSINPPHLAVSNPFQGTPVKKTVYVPRGCVANYQPLTEAGRHLEGATIRELSLTQKVTFTVTPVDATVVVKDNTNAIITAEEDGTYKLAAGTYTYTVTKEGYDTATGSITVAEAALTKTITLKETSTNPPGGDSGDGGSGGGSSGNTTKNNYVQDKYMIERDREVEIDLARGSTLLSAAQLKRLAEQNKNKPVVIKGEDYILTFQKGTMKVVAGQQNHDFGAKFNTGTNYSKIRGLAGSNLALMIRYNHSGKLPAEATITIKVGTKYAGQTLYYYYYNSTTGKLEYLQSTIVDEDGYATVKQDRCSDYVFLTEKLGSNPKENTNSIIKLDPKAMTNVNSSLIPYFKEDNEEIIVKFSAMSDGMMHLIGDNETAYLFRQEVKEFSDTVSHWAKDDIDFVTARELFVGTGNGKFSPDASMTRGMVITVLDKLWGADVSEFTGTRFDDVNETAYYAPYVEWAAANGIVSGIGNDAFAPNRAISREELAVIITKFTKFAGFNLNTSTGNPSTAFADAHTISGWAQDSVRTLQEACIISGKPGNIFGSQDTATRAEFAVILRKLITNIVK
jgi:hypothetical protein